MPVLVYIDRRMMESIERMLKTLARQCHSKDMLLLKRVAEFERSSDELHISSALSVVDSQPPVYSKKCLFREFDMTCLVQLATTDCKKSSSET